MAARSKPSSSASVCSCTGPWLHGPALQICRPRCSYVTGGSYDAENAAMSSPVSTPRLRRPELSMTSARPTKSAIASATKPRRNTSRAAWTCVSRPGPAASASATSRRHVAASVGLRHIPPGAGARPRSSHSSAEVGHSSRNTPAMSAIASEIRGSIGKPCSA